VGKSRSVERPRCSCKMRIRVAGPFVAAEPHLALAAIAASMAAVTKVIPASVFRAEHANITRALTAD
jgi:hypothetical protein